MSSTNRFGQVLSCLNSWVPSLELSRVALQSVGGTELPVGGTELPPNCRIAFVGRDSVGCISIANLGICLGVLPCFHPFDCDWDHADGDNSNGHEDEVFLDPFQVTKPETGNQK